MLKLNPKDLWNGARRMWPTLEARRAEIMRKLDRRHFARAKERVARLSMVRTLLAPREPVSLLSFYYPCRIHQRSFSGDYPLIADIEEERNVVINGVVGQGKSMLARALCLVEISHGRRIPIFIELRKFVPGKNLPSLIEEVCEGLGFPKSLSVFERFAETGEFVLVLDGFDEISQELSGAAVEQIESLVQRFPKLQVVVSSRPGSSIHASAEFVTVSMEPLTSGDYEGFLKRARVGDEERRDIAVALRSAGAAMQELLSTPLMFVLLLCVYRGTGSVPKAMPEFFEGYFRTVTREHDERKPGFMRVYRSQIGPEELRTIFDCFCYLSVLRSVFSMTRTEFLGRIGTARDMSSDDCRRPKRESADIAEDLVSVTCLVRQDGNYLSFLHRSIAEYHAASWVLKGGDSRAAEFYAFLEPEKWRAYSRQLDLIRTIDPQFFRRNFYLPSVLSISEKMGNIFSMPLEAVEANHLRLLDSSFSVVHGFPAAGMAAESGVLYRVDGLLRLERHYGSAYLQSLIIESAEGALNASAGTLRMAESGELISTLQKLGVVHQFWQDIHGRIAALRRERESSTGK